MSLKKLCGKIFSRSEKSDLSYDEAMRLYNENDAILIDVRTPEEYSKRHLEGAINIPLYEMENIENEIKDKNEIILLYCMSGKRSRIAKELLIQNGYQNVYTVKVDRKYIE